MIKHYQPRGVVECLRVIKEVCRSHEERYPARISGKFSVSLSVNHACGEVLKSCIQSYLSARTAI